MFILLLFLILLDFAEDLLYAGGVVGATVEFELEGGEETEAVELFGGIDGDEAGCGLERFEGFLFIGLGGDHADVDFGEAEIEGGFDTGDGDETCDMRVFDFAMDHLEDDFFEQGIDPFDPVVLHSSCSMCWIS